MALSDDTKRKLRASRDEFNTVEAEARRQFEAAVAAARRRYLDVIVEALDEGSQVEIADELGVTRGRVWQLIQEARGADGANQ